jgi:hypothetical protein
MVRMYAQNLRILKCISKDENPELPESVDPFSKSHIMEYAWTENQGHQRRKTMTEQTKVKPSFAGICKFCRGEFEKAKMSQHLKYCKERARMEAETAKSPKGKS